MSIPGQGLSKYIPVGLTWLLVAGLPFEALNPVLKLGDIEVTNLELLVASTLLPQLIRVGQPAWSRRVRSFWRSNRDLIIPAMASLAVSGLSALIAPAHRGEALKSFGRQAVGFYVFLLVLTAAGGHGRRRIVRALLVGATLSSLLGVAEFFNVAFFEPLFEYFKSGPTLVGGQLRVSASFQYASIAAMYYEMTVPIALVLAASLSRRLARVAAMALGILLILLVVLSLTRAGYIALALAIIGLLLASRRTPPVHPLQITSLIALASISLVLAWLAWRNDAFRARLTTENDLGWYGAVYDVPDGIDITKGDRLVVTVTAHNTGLITWPEKGRAPVYLSYRWLSDDGKRVFSLPAVQTPLPRSIKPGESVTLEVSVDPRLPSGQYLLSWELVQEGVFPFSSRGVPEGRTRVNMLPGDDIGPPLPDSQDRHPGEISASPPIITSRLELWRAAVLMWLDRPLVGHGPNNFRHLYGSYLGRSEWDERIHANNLYLQLLADTGLLGLLSFTWLMVAIARRLWPFMFTENQPGLRMWSAGLGAAFLAFLAHGFLDYFFEFHAVSLLFWTLAGLAGAMGHGSRIERA